MEAIHSEILKLLEAQKRPFDVNGLVLNLNKNYGKAAILKALPILVAKNKIIEKTYDKSKIYFFKPVETFNQAAFRELIQVNKLQAAEIEQKMLAITKIIKEKEEKLAQIKSTVSTSDIRKKRDMLLEEKIKLQSALKENKSGDNTKSKKVLEQEKEKCQREWRKRSRTFKDITGAILENSEMSKHDLFEMLCVETDEDVGVKIPSLS